MDARHQDAAGGDDERHQDAQPAHQGGGGEQQPPPPPGPPPMLPQEEHDGQVMLSDGETDTDADEDALSAQLDEAGEAGSGSGSDGSTHARSFSWRGFLSRIGGGGDGAVDGSAPGHQRRHSAAASSMTEETQTLEETEDTAAPSTAASSSTSIFAGLRDRFRRARRVSDTDLPTKEQQVLRLKDVWVKDILPNWSDKMRHSKRVRQLCWVGIPPAVRALAWTAIIGNRVHVNNDLFEINLHRARELRKWQRANAPVSPESGSSRLTSRSEQQSGESSDALVPPVQPAASASREDSLSLIEADVPRTFPQLKIFHGDGPLHQPLVDVLQAFCAFRPDIGYVQGMSYLGAVLLLNMDRLEAFVALVNLLNQDLYFSFFRMDVGAMSYHIHVYQELFAEHLPKLHAHFSELDISPSMYIYPWLLTIFSRSLSLDTAHRVWDNFLFHGPLFLYRVALGILRMHSKELLAGSFEEVLPIISHLPKDLSETDLFDNIHKINIKAKRFDELMEDAQRKSMSDLAQGMVGN